MKWSVSRVNLLALAEPSCKMSFFSSRNTTDQQEEQVLANLLHYLFLQCRAHSYLHKITDNKCPTSLTVSLKMCVMWKRLSVNLCPWLTQSLTGVQSLWGLTCLTWHISYFLLVCGQPLSGVPCERPVEFNWRQRGEQCRVNLSRERCPSECQGFGLGWSALAAFQAVVPWHVEIEKTGHCQGLVWHRVRNIG